MSKPAKFVPYRKAFVDTPKLKIRAIEQEGKIIAFEITVAGETYREDVKGNQITAAFKRIEKMAEKFLITK